MAKFYFPLPAPPNYSEGAWPIWLEGSIYLPVSKCLPRAADTRPRFLRHWPPNSLCGDPLSVPLSFQTVCPRLCTLHRGRGIQGPGRRRALGPWLGAGNRGLRRQPAVPSRLVVPRQALYFLIVFSTTAKWKRRIEAKTGLCPTRRWGFDSSLAQESPVEEEALHPSATLHRIRSIF